MSAAPQEPLTRTTRAWVQQVMGLPISIHVRASDAGRADIAAAVEAVYDRLRRVDAVFSTWREDSDLIRLRRGELGPADAHPWVEEVRVLCEDAEHVTQGLFTTDLVGPDGTRGWDPTGLVKGWAVNACAPLLGELTGVRFCINAGGDLRCGGGPASDTVDPVWRVGIEDPQDPQAITDVIEMRSGALATSGSGARGKHIIDPRAGRPVEHAFASVTVVGPDLGWADVWATASFIDPDRLATRPEPRWESYRVVSTSNRPATVGARLK